MTRRRQPICWEDAIIIAFLACSFLTVIGLLVIASVQEPGFALTVGGFAVSIAAIAVALRRWA